MPALAGPSGSGLPRRQLRRRQGRRPCVCPSCDNYGSETALPCTGPQRPCGSCCRAGSESRYRAALARAAWDDKYVTTLAASMSQHPDVGLGKILFFRQFTDALRPLTATH